jgi:hypothetical protein
MSRGVLGATVLCGGWLVICLYAGTVAGQDATWLEQNHRKDPDRIEGLLDQPNARREYDVLAFEVYPSALPARLPDPDSEELVVEYCRPASQPDAGPAFIEVRQMTVHVNYLMKTSRDPRKSGLDDFTWPARDVIGPYRIDPRKLGVVIHLGEDNEYAEELSPAILTVASGRSKKPIPIGPITSYALSLRIQQRALDSLQYTIEGGGKSTTCIYAGDDRVSCGPGQRNLARRVEAGSLVRLGLPMVGVPDGETRVRVEGSYADSDDKLIASFRFMHERVCK